MTSRVPFGTAAYEKRVIGGPCFVCRYLDGDPEFQHIPVYEDDAHIAFLSKYPTVPGYVLVSPRRHVSHVFRDLSADEYDALMRFTRLVGRGVEAVVPAARTYLASLGSQDANSHIHLHVVPCPPGTPYADQQFALMMTSMGVLATTDAAQRELAATINAAIVRLL